MNSRLDKSLKQTRLFPQNMFDDGRSEADILSGKKIIIEKNLKVFAQL